MVAIGWQSDVKLANGSGGSMLSLLKPQTDRGASTLHTGKQHSHAVTENRGPISDQYKVLVKQLILNSTTQLSFTLDDVAIVAIDTIPDNGWILRAAFLTILGCIKLSLLPLSKRA